MSNRTPGLIKNYIAEAAIGKHRIVKFGTDDDHVILGAAATDKLIGVTTEVPADADERCDVIRSGIAPVYFGGIVAAGDLLTTDANGAAIATTTASNRIIGMAEVAGVSGDLGSVCLSPGII
ncbi:MAG: DUF2190 family protein [Jaaginema sp. PMC 1079.18]|nr:DUF2190 family protein [Jaaginema sp. PMC 1080.18]MEC4851202.1 DUF2190 family protein [Jaaginema sp. PMC 1079.18]MEC4864779.1 DUF2190 family protein [Jaaginema sp. PMC 1078.18]